MNGFYKKGIFAVLLVGSLAISYAYVNNLDSTTVIKEEENVITSTAQEKPAGSVKAIDITNDVLTATDPTCDSYVGSYISEITDVSTGNMHSGSLEIETKNHLCYFYTNQIPSHDLGEGSHFANEASPNEATLIITSNPNTTGQYAGLGMGASAIMLNGIKWEAYPAACFGVGNAPLGEEKIGCGETDLGNPWRYNIGSPLNDFGFDTNFAHVQPGGLYHYHSTPNNLYELSCEGKEASPVVGFAADGFAVHGPCFEDSEGVVRPAASSYALKEGERQDEDRYETPTRVGTVVSNEYDGQFIGDYDYVPGNGDLDICNGMTVDGKYGYYITQGYPYVLACHSGTASTSFR